MQSIREALGQTYIGEIPVNVGDKFILKKDTTYNSSNWAGGEKTFKNGTVFILAKIGSNYYSEREFYRPAFDFSKVNGRTTNARTEYTEFVFFKYHEDDEIPESLDIKLFEDTSNTYPIVIFKTLTVSKNGGHNDYIDITDRLSRFFSHDNIEKSEVKLTKNESDILDKIDDMYEEKSGRVRSWFEKLTRSYADLKELVRKYSGNLAKATSSEDSPMTPTEHMGGKRRTRSKRTKRRLSKKSKSRRRLR